VVGVQASEAVECLPVRSAVVDGAARAFEALRDLVQRGRAAVESNHIQSRQVGDRAQVTDLDDDGAVWTSRVRRAQFDQDVGSRLASRDGFEGVFARAVQVGVQLHDIVRGEQHQYRLGLQ